MADKPTNISRVMVLSHQLTLKSVLFLCFFRGKIKHFHLSIGKEVLFMLVGLLKLIYTEFYFSPKCNCITVVWMTCKMFPSQSENGIAASYFRKGLGSLAISPHSQRMMIKLLLVLPWLKKRLERYNFHHVASLGFKYSKSMDFIPENNSFGIDSQFQESNNVLFL